MFGSRIGNPIEYLTNFQAAGFQLGVRYSKSRVFADHFSRALTERESKAVYPLSIMRSSNDLTPIGATEKNGSP
ncbi:MAG TPA: hypothetical protein DCX46_05330 [Bacteroidetes bacterium]|nr:hypothetical protein [Bacteroidota bacterium]